MNLEQLRRLRETRVPSNKKKEVRKNAIRNAKRAGLHGVVNVPDMPKEVRVETGEGIGGQGSSDGC